MKKVLISALALGAALAAAPSMAQSYGGGYGQGGGYDRGGYGGPGYGRGTPSPWDIRNMVERSIQRGEVSRGDARELRDDVEDLMRLARRSRYGNDWGAQRAVERKSRDILRDLQDARRDGYRGGDRDGPRPGYRPGDPRGGTYDRPGY